MRNHVMRAAAALAGAMGLAAVLWLPASPAAASAQAPAAGCKIVAAGWAVTHELSNGPVWNIRLVSNPCHLIIRSRQECKDQRFGGVYYQWVAGGNITKAEKVFKPWDQYSASNCGAWRITTWPYVYGYQWFSQQTGRWTFVRMHVKF